MKLVLTLAALTFAFAIGWGLRSRWHSIPCPSWLAWLAGIDNPLFRNYRASAIIAGLGLRPGMTVLDAGCGPGRLTLPMAREVGPQGRVVALDLQAGMLRKAEARAQRAGQKGIVFWQADIARCELNTGAFDRAVLVAVLGEVPDKRAALRAVFKALKPGGILAVAEVIADPHFQPRSSVIEMAEAIGFRERSCTGSRLSYTLYFEKPPSSQ